MSVCAPGFEFCGPLLCVPSAEKNCSSKIANMVKSVVGTVTETAKLVNAPSEGADLLKSIAGTVEAFMFP